VTYAEFDAAARALPGATHEILWGEDHVYKVGGKMFAATGPEARGFSCKVSDIAFEALTETGRAKPSPYLARAKWVRFENLPELGADEVADWIGQSHALVAARLPKKVQRELGLA
jgi:predicted DNA-binding protein (MmcQ/YjbR family)